MCSFPNSVDVELVGYFDQQLLKCPVLPINHVEVGALSYIVSATLSKYVRHTACALSMYRRKFNRLLVENSIGKYIENKLLHKRAMNHPLTIKKPT